MLFLMGEHFLLSLHITYIPFVQLILQTKGEAYVYFIIGSQKSRIGDFKNEPDGADGLVLCYVPTFL